MSRKTLPEGAAAAQLAAMSRLYRSTQAGSGCTVCRGSGYITDRAGKRTTCPKCRGSGRP